MARKNCELIPFLNIKPLLKKYQSINNVVKETIVQVETQEANIDTDTHIIPEMIDPNYKCNIWDLKRQAISLANMMICRTVASQTIKSSAVTTSTQVYDSRNKSVQTKCDNYTNTPTILQEIVGLRGRKDDMQEQLNMTFYDFKQECQNKSI